MTELKVQNRVILGRKVRALREQDLIPAELYGHGVKNLHLTLSAKEFKKVFKEAGESTIVNLETEDDKKLPVMIHYVRTDPLSGEILNVDFYQIKLSEKIRVRVPVEFAGEAPAVKTYGGILVKTIQEIEVEALPQDLPHNVPVELTSLDEIGKKISLKDLKISDKIKVFLGPDAIIATVVEAKPEEVAETPPAETAAGEIPAAGTAPAAGSAEPAAAAPGTPKK